MGKIPFIPGPAGKLYQCTCHRAAWHVARRVFETRVAELAGYDDTCRALHVIDGHYRPVASRTICTLGSDASPRRSAM